MHILQYIGQYKY